MTSGVSRFFFLASETAEENAEFINKNAKHIASEVLELVNDAIDYMTFFIKLEDAVELSFRQTLVFYANHIFMPASYSIFINFWLGNVPNCFRELRFLIESLAKSYLADLKYPSESFFEAKLESLRRESKKRNDEDVPKREHDFIEEFDRELGFDRKSVKVWGKLSAEVHTTKYVKRFMDHIVGKSDMPSYAFAIPMSYTAGDLQDLQELHDFICDYRQILKATIEGYKTIFGY